MAEDEGKGGFWRGLVGRKPRERPADERRDRGEPGETTEPAPAADPPDTADDRAGEPRSGADGDAPAAPPPEPGEPEAGAAEAPKGWFGRLRRGLSRSSNQLTESVTGLFTKKKLDATTLQDLEDTLIQADLGVDTAMRVTDRLSEARYQKGISSEELQEVLASEIEAVLAPVAQPLAIDPDRKPFVILVVGVNGTGKTTTIGKLSAKLAHDGRRVVLAAGDTFRAAAVEQLGIWGERTGATVVARETGADAAGLVFDALDTAKREAADVLLVDTAGRLQNRAELMAELEKVVRVIRRKDETAPHAVLLTLDATTGQNAMNQVDIFKKQVGVTGLVMTKLDGTARGGILVAIAAKHGLPVHYVGVGEGVDDLAPFSARDFARAIAGLD
jgi:fused signal recognition particle receptor